MSELRRVPMRARPDWKEIALSLGVDYFQNADGSESWREDVAYQFSDRLVSEIGLASMRLNKMCRDFVAEAVNSPEVMADFGIPEAMWPVLKTSWDRRDPFFIGRFDFALVDGVPKMIEFNADTPATVPETISMQKRWLADVMPDGRQASWLESTTIMRLRELHGQGQASGYDARLPDVVHVVPFPGCREDYAHAEVYSRWLEEAGMQAIIAELADIEATTSGELIHRGVLIRSMIRMYPWEIMFREPGARHLLTCSCRFMSPPWTALLSNKALLPALWKRYEGHPNLIRSQNTPEGMDRHVIKPVCSRGGENVRIIMDGETVASKDGTYGAYRDIYQEYVDCRIDGVNASIGAWIVGQGRFGGIVMRESPGMIIKDDSAIVPHFIA